jgi:hypothetical protein
LIILVIAVSQPSTKPGDSFNNRAVCMLFGAVIGGAAVGVLLTGEEEKGKEKLEREHREFVESLRRFYHKEIDELRLPGEGRPVTRDEFDKMWGDGPIPE